MAMKLLLYEWCCSGGLAGRASDETLESIAGEGRMMLEALAADASRDPSLDVSVLVESMRSIDLPSGVNTRAVDAGHELETLADAARQADWSIVVAPETEGILEDRVAGVRAAGGAILAPSAAFLALAADKQATALALAAAGVPVPAGRPLAAGEPAPQGFRMPAVRKIRDGVGCDAMVILRDGSVGPSPRPTRLEAFAAGMPVGVSCLCGVQGIDVLPPMRQRFTPGDTPRYLASEPFDDASLAERASRLAQRAIAAVERAAGDGPAVGWVGVDMILGERDDGRNDRVLEVNPRLTTSFVWLAPRSGASLVRSMIDRAGSHSR